MSQPEQTVGAPQTDRTFKKKAISVQCDHNITVFTPTQILNFQVSLPTSSKAR